MTAHDFIYVCFKFTLKFLNFFIFVHNWEDILMKNLLVRGP